MPEVISFVDYRPPARFDSLPWTQARIEEANSETGSYTALETKTLSPVDTDPASPQLRSFTTEHGTALDYWYRIVFVDATGDLSQPTTPVQNTGGSTVTTSVYATQDELFRILKIRTPTVEQQAAADRLLTVAAGEINSKIQRADALSPWMVALCTEVNLERAAEYWLAEEIPMGVAGLDSPVGPVYIPQRSPALRKLLPLQQAWGVS